MHDVLTESIFLYQGIQMEGSERAWQCSTSFAMLVHKISEGHIHYSVVQNWCICNMRVLPRHIQHGASYEIDGFVSRSSHVVAYDQGSGPTRKSHSHHEETHREEAGIDDEAVAYHRVAGRTHA